MIQPVTSVEASTGTGKLGHPALITYDITIRLCVSLVAKTNYDRVRQFNQTSSEPRNTPI